MKNIYLLAAIILTSFSSSIANPGDTIVVKTFTFDSISNRRAVFEFPAEQNWEKILMLYTLKCDNATPWDGYACGEWDYTTYTNIYEHTGLLDSTTYNHSRYTLNNGIFETFDACNSAKYHTWESEYDYSTYTFSSSTDITFGSNDVYSDIGISTGNLDSKTYLLYKNSDLLTAGLTVGDLVNLSFTTNSTDILSFPITLKLAQGDLESLSLSDINNLSFTNLYHGLLTYDGGGVINITFTEPFTWDGLSNLIFEISLPNNTNSIELETQNNAYSSILCSNTQDYYLDFEKFSYIDVPAAIMSNINDQISICCWIYGDPDIQAQNDYLFEAYDSNGDRQLCVHYPWSNGSIYWDAGNDGNGYDRIYKAAAENQYEGQWNHLAFVKNTTSGTMSIYINGVLWHSENGKTKAIHDIEEFIIGCSANQSEDRSYDGFIDDFSVWNIELDESQIQNLMYSKLDNSHENYDNLIVYYDFNEEPGAGNTIIDNSLNNNNAYFLGTLNRKSFNGINRFKVFDNYAQIPVVSFTQGDFTYETNTNIYQDSVMLNQQIVLEYENIDFYSIHAIDTTLCFPNYNISTDINNISDTSFVTADFSFINSDLTYYSESFERINTIQVQNYVTPYGIGLTLGANGFTWVYDVSDYCKYLQGDVDILSHNTQELLDLSFVFIEGTPPRNVLSFDQVYRGNFGQYNIAEDISLQAKKIKRNPDAVSYRVKTRTTGHGMAGAGNCAEFCPTYHNISVEGEQRYEWYNWKECADNPVQPQGGTWIFDRAGWCPGSFADTYDWNITEFVTGADSIELDYGMTQYAVGSGEGNYNISVQLIQYGEINFDTDAAIEDIIAPSNASIYGKYNPVCNNPKIKIKNTGSSDLNSLLIEYGINGDYSYTHQWTGTLEFLETEEVSLPTIDWREFTSNNIFNVRVLSPNEIEDEYPANNTYTSSFEKVDLYTDTIMLVFRTNNYGDESHYQVLDQEGNILVDRDDLTSNTIYYDTLDFPPGCYEIRIFDRGEDGLDFWYYSGADGTGYAKLRIPDAQYVKHFKADFGSFIQYQFVYPDLSYIYNEELNKAHFDVYPNPNNGTFTLQLNFEPTISTQITIRDIYGREIKKFIGNDIPSANFKINLNELNKAVYYININSGKINQTKKLVVQ